MAGDTPREFATITVTDGIATGHQDLKSSLVSRDLIADSVGLTIRGHRYVTLIGSNPWFHLPQDRWPHAADVAAVEWIASAVVRMVVALTR